MGAFGALSWAVSRFRIFAEQLRGVYRDFIDAAIARTE
jgi:hypothetical protein